jgi:18S rRNA (guanine1575-N7)-methyltransferase
MVFRAILQNFYNETEASKYHQNSRIMQIQMEISNRAVELLALPPGKSAFILDVGCGSGLSGGTVHGLRTCQERA